MVGDSLYEFLPAISPPLFARNELWPAPKIHLGAKRRSPPRRGTSSVEFAIASPIFFMLIFGIIEFGRAYMVLQLLTESARVGCRQGVLEGTTTQQIKDAAVNYLTAVGISGESVKVSINDGAGNVTEASAVPAYTEITVVVSVTVSKTSWVPQLSRPKKSLSGQWTMRRE